MTKLKLLLTLPLLLLLSLPAAPGRADGGGPPEHFSGRYLFAGGIDEADRLRSTLDEMLRLFNPFLRGLARRRLHHTIRIPEGVEIGTAGAAISVEVRGAPGFGSDATFEDGALVQRLSNFEGKRTTRFALSEDGQRLTMRVLTQSALLPEDLRYELTFVRDPDAFVGGVLESGSGS